MASDKMIFVYRNWRGETRERTVIPHDIEFGEKPHHSGRQWFLNAFCCEKGAMRSFAVEDILSPIRHVEPVENRPVAGDVGAA